jgi:hypothetical protein
MFLGAIIGLSCILYLPGLGWYSDDWAFLARLTAADGSFGSQLRAILAANMIPRPVQAFNLTLLFRLFQLDPVGYHLWNSLVLVTIVLLLHRLLVNLRAPREIALAVPLVFGLLPHYSTDRFWIAAFQVNIAMCAALASVILDMRFARTPNTIRWLWKAMGSLALLVSVLSYEVAAPLFLVSPFLIWLGVRPSVQAEPRAAAQVVLPLLASNVIALTAAVAFKATVSERVAISASPIQRMLSTLVDATTVGLGTYGVGLPLTVGRVLRHHFDLRVLVVSLLIALGTAAYIWRVARRGERPFHPRATWLRLIIAGAVVFVMGYGVALLAADIHVAATGVNNRTAIAAALGIATVFVASAGLASGLWPGNRLRWRSFQLLIAALAFSGTLLVNTIAGFYVAAASAQGSFISDLRRALPSIPSGSTVLIDGLCPFIGPAIVFETQWDVTGMLRMVYGDPTLLGNVVGPEFALDVDAVVLSHYVAYEYPYGDQLFVYDVGRRRLRSLTSLADARRYFEQRADPSCPAGTPGKGEAIF